MRMQKFSHGYSTVRALPSLEHERSWASVLKPDLNALFGVQLLRRCFVFDFTSQRPLEGCGECAGKNSATGILQFVRYQTWNTNAHGPLC